MTATGSFASSDVPQPTKHKLTTDNSAMQQSAAVEHPLSGTSTSPQAASDATCQPPKSAGLHVVLYQPQIPQNTGNIARTCVALRAKLWIVRPTMFRLDSSQLKRAGLDYWQYLSWQVVDSWDDLLSHFDEPRLWLISKFGKQPYFDANFQHGDLIVLGRESDGLPQSLRDRYREQMLHIPMPGEVRSLNVGNAAAVVMYEAARKIGMLDGCPGIAES